MTHQLKQEVKRLSAVSADRPLHLLRWKETIRDQKETSEVQDPKSSAFSVV